MVTQEDKYKIVSNNYLDMLIRNNPASLKKYQEYSTHIMNDNLAVIYMPLTEITSGFVAQHGYSAIPHCYALTNKQSLEASGVIRLRNITAINLRGNGVIVGIIDTGIDYTNPVFQHADGTSRILAIWDQSIDSINEYPNTTYPSFYGTEYTQEQINQALKSANSMEIVPTVDEIGHGTKLAGIAAGSENQEYNFSGVAPNADILVVKLKQAKAILTDYYAIPQNVPCYQENDIIWAIQYLVDKARSFRRPISICIGLGTSLGAHENAGFLNTAVSMIGDFVGVGISISAGNESNLRRHFYGSIDPTLNAIPVELIVGENEAGFTMELWGDPPTIYSLDIISPAGEYISVVSGNLAYYRDVSFIFEKTIIHINYFLVETVTGKEVILMRFMNPSKGIWKFQVYARGDLPGMFHIWLPSGDFISDNTFFINSNPYTTITSPGNSIVPITVTAYNQNNDAIYPNAGKGFSTSSIINPDLAAPGLAIQCPALDHSFTTMTGTSAATAHTAGIAAMILEWCIVDNNYPNINTIGIKKFLNRGAKRSSQLQYPNRDWGYGIIDIYNSFNLLRTDYT